MKPRLLSSPGLCVSAEEAEPSPPPSLGKPPWSLERAGPPPLLLRPGGNFPLRCLGPRAAGGLHPVCTPCPTRVCEPRRSGSPASHTHALPSARGVRLVGVGGHGAERRLTTLPGQWHCPAPLLPSSPSLLDGSVSSWGAAEQPLVSAGALASRPQGHGGPRPGPAPHPRRERTPRATAPWLSGGVGSPESPGLGAGRKLLAVPSLGSAWSAGAAPTLLAVAPCGADQPGPCLLVPTGDWPLLLKSRDSGRRRLLSSHCQVGGGL